MPLLMRLLIVLGFIPLFAVSKSQSSKASVSSLSSLMDSIFPQECGIRMIRKTKRGRVKRIVGGSQSSQGKWPWQVALYFKGHHYCGGAVISNTWILTAAHCFNPHTSSKPEDWTAVLGDHSLKKRDERVEQRRNILNITIHEGYRSMWYEKIYDTPPLNDVAIMKLHKALVFNTYVQPLCLPRPHDVFAPNEECYVAGWGHTEWNGTQPDILREAKVRIVSRGVCNQEKSYNGTIHNTAMCAGYPEGGTDACEYDSGGPLVCSKCGRYYAAGLVSWGDQCALPYKYGVYSNLTVLTPWITERISTFETDKVALSVFQG